MSMIENASASFDRWIVNGATRSVPGLDSLDPERDLWPSFWQGWKDAREHVSDFKRRGMELDRRVAYMAGRFLSTPRPAFVTNRDLVEDESELAWHA